MGSEPNRATLDELVSYNLRRARELRGWTQAEAAGRVSSHLGRSWSEQVYGDAERAYRNPKRVKVFTGEEMLALALAFDLPIPWFYLPPTIDTEVGARGTQDTISGRELLWLLVPESHPDGDRSARAASFIGRLEELGKSAGLELAHGDLPAPLGRLDFEAVAAASRVRFEQIEQMSKQVDQFFEAIGGEQNAQQVGELLRQALERRGISQDGEEAGDS